MASNAASQQDLDSLVSGLAPGDGAEGGEGKKKKGRKLLFILLPVALLLLGGGGAYVAGLLDPLLGKTEEAADGHGGEAAHGEVKPGEGKPGEHGAAAAADPVFYDLPDMLVNLHTTGTRAAYLKIKLALQYTDPLMTPVLQKVQPRIIDSFQIYLRELRIEDLEGSAGLMRLKEELLARSNQLMAPARIDDVLFKEMLVQ
ncbi:flagellar basal body-associated FliL family protein [Zavarzinia compransoris]|uniref:Flagellar protein FliL n=1 Tax=Zavarzinia compransoris TaxID=1264899 RepID=A0A317DYH1_9PROT|nr:flagellar basal body-associated FliL family protein [Zavarzinia compransoris]PWR19797.1 flagellar basal body protein FliL [Zavarzinia compransoris]TDP45098.1 flagellar FliL protein [Zavarzinia compransoris]